MSSQQAPSLSSKDRFLHLKSFDVTFPSGRLNSAVEVKLKVEPSKYKSPKLQAEKVLHWKCEVYIEANARALFVIRKPRPIRRSAGILASFCIDFQAVKFADDMSIELNDEASGVTVKIILGDAKSTSEITGLLANKAKLALASAAKVNMLEKLSKVLGCLKFAIDIGKDAAQFYPPLQPVVPVVAGALQRLQEIPDVHHELTQIMDDVASVLPSVELALRHAQIEEVRQPIYEYFDIAKGLSERIMETYSVSTTKFILRSLRTSRRHDVTELAQRLTTLKGNTHFAVTVQNQAKISDMHQHLLSEVDERILEQLKPPTYSSYDTDRCCLLGTRVSLIQEIIHWSQSTDTPSRLFWLHGVAGCGKSSVATSVAEALDEPENQHIPSYSFFCKRDDPERRRAIRVVHAIAYYLARASEPYRIALLRKLKKDPTLPDSPLRNQIKALLADCIKDMSGSAPPHPIIIILDALDECDENEKVSKLLVDIIKSVSWIKLIVTSRPLQSIQENLESSGTLLSPYDLFRTPTTEDILVYTKHQFEDGGKLVILRKYVTPTDIEELARKALGLFIWITVVCSYVGQRKSERLNRFKAVIQSTNAPDSEKQLDELYLQVLNHVAGSTETGASKADIRLITAVVLATSRNRALPAEALFAFGSPEYRGLPEEWQDLLQDLRSVLVTDARTNAIRVCHKSFLDFLGSQERSGEFWTESSELEQLMTKKCLSVMLAPSGLKFNICKLKTSCLPNRDVEDLNVDQHISQELQYSCIYWLNHLSESYLNLASQDSIRSMLRELLCRVKSFYWLEAMSLMSELREAGLILDAFMNLVKGLGSKDELYAFASDLYRFVKAFHEPMAMSTPHIYISALVWAPSESLVAKLVGPTFNSRACILDGHNELWSNNIQTMLASSEVTCVVYSPDGRRIISGTHDGTVRIWDAETGTPLGDPLRGHSKRVLSLKYSPDGRRIVSGSDDCTIRIWDAETGATVGEPLRGNVSWVVSVNYSPDGRRIVSGSRDGTIRLWDARTGAPVGRPLQSHDSRFLSVDYSPDGRRIVSGSHDGTIRLWDAATGAPVSEPLRGHQDYVRSVKYSPDGRRILSGSDDRTIRMWDASSGALIGAPLQGHRAGINSLNYSPDGRCIVSGSDDCTIRLWEAETGAPVGGPLQGHELRILSVSYSPDGRRIVSGSDDCTIRLWDTETGIPVVEPLHGHDSRFLSVDCSPDGRRIVSGSHDGTIRLWDAETGVPVGKSLRGHQDYVRSVKYSPDGRRIVSGSDDRTIRIWDAETGATVCKPLRGHVGWVSSVNYSPDGRWIVSGSRDGTIRLWDAETGAPVREPFRGHGGAVLSVGYSPDGSRIVSGSGDRTIRVWDVSTGALVGKPLRGHSGSVRSASYSPDGRHIVSGSDDRTVRIWDVETDAPIGEPLRGHGKLVLSVNYSPDGRRIVSGSGDGTILIWDADTAAPVGERLRGHDGQVLSVNFSPDGRRIVSGSDDGTIRIWNAEACAPLAATHRIREEEDCMGSTSEKQTASSREAQIHTHTSYDASSWEEGEWKYCVDKGWFLSRNPEARAHGGNPISLSRRPQQVAPDGWIRTTDDGLLLWIPPEYRHGVCDMSLYCVPRSSPGHHVEIDWEGLYYGTAWTAVKVED